MMNIVKAQDQLKNFSQDQLVREMQTPSGSVPQFLVLGEIMRRQRMQQGMATQQGGEPQSTVAEDAVAAAGVPQGGLASMARAMAPKTDMAQNTGVVAMAGGGMVTKMAAGDKIVRNGMVLTEQEDGSYKDERGRVVRTVGEDISAGIASIRGIPSRLGSALRDFSGGFADEMNADLARTGGEAMRRQMAEDVYGMRAGPDTSYQYPPVPTMDTTGLDQIAAAFSRTGPMTGAPVDLNLVAAGVPSEPTALDLITQRAWESTAPGAGLGGPNVIPQAQRIEPNVSAALPVVPPAPVETGDPMLRFQENFDVGLDQGPSPGIGERIFGRPALEKAGLIDKPLPPEGPAFEGRGRGDAPTGAKTLDELITQDKEEKAAAAAEVAAAAAPPGGGGGGGGGGGIAGATGMSSYEQELMDMLGRREKAAEQDKWLALAQVGLNMMSSTNPTLLGAIGEAGVKGVEAARSARDQYDKDRLELLGAIEQSRMSRAAAAAKAARGASGGEGAGIMGISASAGRLLREISSDIARIDGLLAEAPLTTMTPDQELERKRLAQERDALVAERYYLLYNGPVVNQEDDDTSFSVVE
jgi:hypothetical protein